MQQYMVTVYIIEKATYPQNCGLVAFSLSLFNLSTDNWKMKRPIGDFLLFY